MTKPFRITERSPLDNTGKLKIFCVVAPQVDNRAIRPIHMSPRGFAFFGQQSVYQL